MKNVITEKTTAIKLVVTVHYCKIMQTKRASIHLYVVFIVRECRHNDLAE